jgi:restriction system protein
VSITGLESTFAPEESMAHWREDHWSPAVFAAIEWRRFEALCEAFYAQVGLETRSQSHGADGGVDIWLKSKHMPEPRIVQCKHWKTKPVGVKDLREFRGVMASNQLKHGTYVTSSTFTAEAAAFAKSNRIQTQDGAALLKLISQRTPEQQKALLAVAYEGEYWRPTCASCGVKMVERTGGLGKKAFWGCANSPTCRGKSIPKKKEAVAMG